MKKNKEAKNLDAASLPRTRKEEFKDILRTRYLTLLSIGGILLLFAIPLLVCYGLKNYVLLQIISGLTEKEAAYSTQMAYISVYTLIFDAAQIICFGVFFIGLAGASKIIKSLTYMEPVFFKEDFFHGIKDNWKHYLIISLFVSLAILLFHLVYNMGYYAEIKYLIYGSWIVLGLFAFTFGPILIMSTAMTSTYYNTFSETLKASAILAIRYYFPYVLFGLGLIAFGLGLYFMGLYVHYFICIAVVSVLILYALPIYMLGNYLFCFSKFDIHVNEEHPEILYKGLYREDSKTED